MYFHGARFSNYEAWLSDPTHIKPSAQIVWPVVGQEILNGDVGGGFQGIQITSGFFQLWRASGITSELQLYTTAIGGLILAGAMFFAGWFHYHKAAPKLEWFQNVESMLNHHLAGLLGLGSLAWAGHQIHVSLPINKLLDAGVDPKEIPLPHDFLLNRNIIADLYPSFSKGLAPFFTLNWNEYSDFLTFKGGLNPVTGGLWLSDTAHHHLAIAVLFLVAGHMYRTNWGIGHSMKEILEAHKGPFTGEGHVGLYEILTTSWHAQLAINLALFGSLSIIVAYMLWVTLNSTICWNSLQMVLNANKARTAGFFFKFQNEIQLWHLTPALLDYIFIMYVAYAGVLNFFYGTISQIGPISRKPFEEQKSIGTLRSLYLKTIFWPLYCYGVGDPICHIGRRESLLKKAYFFVLSLLILLQQKTLLISINDWLFATFTLYLNNRYLSDGILRDYTWSAFYITLISIFAIRKNSKSENYDFSAYLPYKPQHISSISSDYLSWFIGFSEGDGSFLLKSGKPCFVINQADLSLLNRMRTILGFGYIYKFVQKNSTYARYIVDDKKSIERLIHIFNGNIQLNKVNVRFSRWVLKFNEVYGYKIVIKPRRKPNMITLKSSWLAGFVDAEGGFCSRIADIKRVTVNNSLNNNKRLYVFGTIDQKNEFEVMQQISKLLNVTNVTIRNAVKEYHRVEIRNKESLLIYTNYLDKYKLRGKKRLAYEIWRDIVRMFLNNEHLQNMEVISKKSKKLKDLNAL
uniref:Photosystem I P700 apoprotein A1 n=1 Tax=Borodinellopsis insignis TaxID=3229915 RepID=A0AB39U3V0_9CHLO